VVAVIVSRAVEAFAAAHLVRAAREGDRVLLTTND
jgi:hypothetical protein